MTSKTGELVIGSKVSRRKAAARLKYECTVAAVKSTHTSMFAVPPPSDTVLPVSRCRCGRTNRASRIVGGNLVQPNEYPWQVALFRNNETARIAGLHHLRYLGFLRCSLLGQIVRHEGFSFRKPVQHDIGLVELDEPLDFPEDNSVAPVCLPRPHLSHPRTNAMVVGWGATENFGGRSKILRFANVKTMTNEACQVLVGLTGGVTPNTICAGHLFSGETACYDHERKKEMGLE
ncbi:clotting factor G beta subunit-like [Macrobrachium nipponense]|uniref:clotting factor G beta subunit-like n=1 Tax=Macrobrachium nipponense TaxID=159736 RepID=UPI0030C89D61